MFTQLKFLKSATSKKDYPDTTKMEISLVGRSNVGKSSFINKLSNQKNTARVSNKPGKTRLINFYEARNIRIVDLPGYGYAKVSKNEREKWKGMIEEYLLNRPNLISVIQLVDIRQRTEGDRIMYEFLREMYPKILILATKIDKLSKVQILENLQEIQRDLGISREEEIIPVSSKTGENMSKVFIIMESILKS